MAQQDNRARRGARRDAAPTTTTAALSRIAAIVVQRARRADGRLLHRRQPQLRRRPGQLRQRQRRDRADRGRGMQGGPGQGFGQGRGRQGSSRAGRLRLSGRSAARDSCGQGQRLPQHVGDDRRDEHRGDDAEFPCRR